MVSKELIIKMAREAGWPNWDGDTPTDDHEFEDFTEPLERFAALVAAAEREACAKVCDDMAAHYWAKDDAIESLNCEECAVAIRSRSGEH